MIKSLVNFCHCSLHGLDLIDLCCMSVVNFFSLAPLLAQFVAYMVVFGVKTGPLYADPARQLCYVPCILRELTSQLLLAPAILKVKWPFTSQPLLDETAPFQLFVRFLFRLLAFLCQLSEVAQILLVRVTMGVVVTNDVHEVSALLHLVVPQIPKLIPFLVQMAGVAHDASYCTPYEGGCQSLLCSRAPSDLTWSLSCANLLTWLWMGGSMWSLAVANSPDFAAKLLVLRLIVVPNFVGALIRCTRCCWKSSLAINCKGEARGSYRFWSLIVLPVVDGTSNDWRYFQWLIVLSMVGDTSDGRNPWVCVGTVGTPSWLGKAGLFLLEVILSLHCFMLKAALDSVLWPRQDLSRLCLMSWVYWIVFLQKKILHWESASLTSSQT